SLHPASRRISALLVAEGIGTRCSGKHPLWKQNGRMGKRTNQHVVQVPHARFIELLTYKAELVGIQVRLTEERSTSKASFLDAALLPVYGGTRRFPPSAASGSSVACIEQRMGGAARRR